MIEYSNRKELTICRRIEFAEKLLQNYGAKLAGVTREKKSCYRKDGTVICEEREQTVWRRKDKYIRVDVILSERPFLVLECSDEFNGPYEDKDPFPHDISDTAMELKIQSALRL